MDMILLALYPRRAHIMSLHWSVLIANRILLLLLNQFIVQLHVIHDVDINNRILKEAYNKLLIYFSIHRLPHEGVYFVGFDEFPYVKFIRYTYSSVRLQKGLLFFESEKKCNVGINVLKKKSNCFPIFRQDSLCSISLYQLSYSRRTFYANYGNYYEVTFLFVLYYKISIWLLTNQ